MTVDTLNATDDRERSDQNSDRLRSVAVSRSRSQVMTNDSVPPDLDLQDKSDSDQSDSVLSAKIYNPFADLDYMQEDIGGSHRRLDWETRGSAP